MSKYTIESYKPLGNRVLVRVLEQETKTASGIIIPDTAKEKQVKGVVVKKGSGCEEEDLIEGHVVTFSQYGGVDVKFEGVADSTKGDYKVFRESDFMGIFSHNE